MEDEVQIGPFSHLRPGVVDRAQGEARQLRRGQGQPPEPGVQQHHFSYIGDAVLGERTNVGAGTITCNYDGVRKHKTRIGKRVFLGSDTMLVAPVELGDEARTGAGAVVTRDVPAGMLALGVPARIRKPRPPGGEPPPRQGRMSDLILQLLVVLVLILIEAVFVMAEISLVTLRHSRIEQMVDEGHRGARRVRRLVADPTQFLAVVQIGVTFVGFLASAYAAVSLADRLARAFAGVPVLEDHALGFAVVIVTIVLALFTIVVGELVPKTLALARPDRVALALAGPVDVLGRILAPLVSFLTWLTRKIAGLFGTDVARQAQISTQELKLIVERGGEQGILEAEEEQMISAVIEFGDRRLHEIMVPRTDMTALPVTASMDEVIDTFVREGHSRIPVYNETIDEIVGILLAKDLLPFLKGADQKPNLRKLLRPPLFVPESMSIDDLLHKLQGRRGPPGDRTRRVRRHGRHGHDRGSARGDRRRDPGRVRRGGTADDAADGRQCQGRRAGFGRRPRRAVRPGARPGSRIRRNTTRSAA